MLKRRTIITPPARGTRVFHRVHGYCHLDAIVHFDRRTAFACLITEAGRREMVNLRHVAAAPRVSRRSIPVSA